MDDGPVIRDLGAQIMENVWCIMVDVWWTMLIVSLCDDDDYEFVFVDVVVDGDDDGHNGDDVGDGGGDGGDVDARSIASLWPVGGNVCYR